MTVAPATESVAGATAITGLRELERPGAGRVALLGRAVQHALAAPVPAYRVRLRNAWEQACAAALGAVPGAAVTPADQVAGDVVGQDLDGVRIRQLVAVHHYG